MNYSEGENTNDSFRSGMIALAGRPNVGKSTLLNQLLGEKISITSRRANTTRHRILGILSEPERQFVFVDMPGFNPRSKRLVDRVIHKTAVASISGVDVVLFIVESRGWQPQDAGIWKQIESEDLPAIIVVNKVDRMRDRQWLLPIIKDLSERTGNSEIVPISALKNENIDLLKSVINQYLPHSSPFFPSSVTTDRDAVFQAGELIREQIFRRYGQELPYICAVEIEKFEQEGDMINLHALVWVETENQKRIIIGANGEKLKNVGISVRMNLESRYECRANVQLWVKSRPRWTDDQRLISYFGYSTPD